MTQSPHDRDEGNESKEHSDLPDIAPVTWLEELQSHSRPTGLPPEGIQRIIAVRDGESLTIGLRSLPTHQPGMIPDETLYWGINEHRCCIEFATSKDALVESIKTPDQHAADPVVRKRIVRDTSKLYEGSNGELVTVIPAKVREDYDPLPPGAPVNIRPDGFPEVALAEVDRVYVLIATHYPSERGVETVFSLLSPLQLAEELSLTSVSKLLSPHNEQARVLTDLPTHPRLSEHYSRLTTVEELPPDTKQAVTHGRSVPPSYLRAALRTLQRAGALALFVDPP